MQNTTGTIQRFGIFANPTRRLTEGKRLVASFHKTVTLSLFLNKKEKPLFSREKKKLLFMFEFLQAQILFLPWGGVTK